jgi:hypothetical protein
MEAAQHYSIKSHTVIMLICLSKVAFWTSHTESMLNDSAGPSLGMRHDMLLTSNRTKFTTVMSFGIINQSILVSLILLHRDFASCILISGFLYSLKLLSFLLYDHRTSVHLQWL